MAQLTPPPQIQLGLIITKMLQWYYIRWLLSHAYMCTEFGRFDLFKVFGYIDAVLQFYIINKTIFPYMCTTS